MEVLEYPNEILKEDSVEITEIFREIKELARDMQIILEKNNAAGLAAPQVGYNVRLIIVAHNTVMVNPKIVWKSKETTTGAEQCLSIPGKFYEKTRNRDITVSYKDLDGYERVQDFTGDLSICIQHEIDHLDGVLING